MSKPRWKRCGVAECFQDRACHNEFAGRDCLVTQEAAEQLRALQAFALRISERVQCDELRVQRMFGADWTEAYAAAWRVMDEVHEIVLAPERPAVYLPCRMVSRANAGAPI